MSKYFSFLKNNFFLMLVVILAFFLRVYRISDIPPSLNWDEVSHGYNAYSILKTGRDEWGIKFPLIFRAYGDFKLPLYIYLTALSEACLGLTAVAVRLVSVLSGVGLVFLAYLITRRLTKNDSWGLLAAFLTALTPWGLFLSRVAVEANLGAFLFALGMYFLVSWLEDFKQKNLVFLSLAWGLSLNAYNSARILVPLFVLLVLFLAFKKKKIKQLSIFVLLTLFFLLPVIFQFLNRSGSSRFGWVSLLDEAAVYQIGERRLHSTLPKLVAKAIFNRPTFFLFSAAKNYLSNFSPGYLFFRGGSHYQFSLPDHELLYLVMAPFLLFGLWQALKGKIEKRIIFVWFMMAFLPSAVTKDSPHVLRSILVLPTPMILSTLGIKWLNDRLKERSFFKGKFLILVIVICILISFGCWWSDYMSLYSKSFSWSWQYGYKEAVLFVKENYQKYDKIFFTKRYGEPHEFILFYFNWEPISYQNDINKVWDYHANWYWVDGFDKFEFVNDWQVAGNVKCEVRSGKCLLVTSPGNYPGGWSEIKTINFLDGKPAFEILESKPE